MQRLAIPLVFAVLALGATFLIDIGQGEAVDGDPEWSWIVVNPGNPLEEGVYVEWTNR